VTTIDRSQARQFPTLGPDLLEKTIKIVDLTRPIFEGMPMWFGHQKTFITTNQTHQQFKEIWKTEVGFEAHNLILSEHAGTHTDAVFEYEPAGPTIEESPLEFWYGPAICLDVSHVEYPDYITEEILAEALAKSGQEIRRGDTVLLYIGWGDRSFPDISYSERHPGLTREAAIWLAEKGVINIGVDQVAIDHSDDRSFAGHVVCGEYGIVNTEGLTNLSQLVNKRFLFFGLPLRIRNGTGSPIRAIAILDGLG
jgi:kynurenine formamidase